MSSDKWLLGMLLLLITKFNVRWEYLNIYFFIWTRVLKNNKYVEIKQFFKVDIKQNNIFHVIL